MTACGASARVGPVDQFGMSVRRFISCTRTKHQGMHRTHWVEPVTNELGAVIGTVEHEAKWVGELAEVPQVREAASA